MVSLTDLPTACLERILKWLPLTRLFVVMRVCREWNAIGKTLVREWQVIKVVSHADTDVNSILVEYNDHADARMVACFKKYMRQLRCLHYWDDEGMWQPLAELNAATLRQLQCYTFTLRHGFCYPLLHQLNAYRIQMQDWTEDEAKAQAAAMPCLRSLELRSGSLAVLHHLPPQQMTRLHVTAYGLNSCFTSAAWLAQPILQMHALKDLQICYHVGQDSRPLLQLLSAFQQLTSLDYSASACVDDCIADLVRMNANLSSVRITDTDMTDETLRQITPAKRLTRLTLEPKRSITLEIFSTDAVCDFLTGFGSRACLENISMSFRYHKVPLDMARVQQEMENMAREQGKRLKREFGFGDDFGYSLLPL